MRSGLDIVMIAWEDSRSSKTQFAFAFAYWVALLVNELRLDLRIWRTT